MLIRSTARRSPTSFVLSSLLLGGFLMTSSAVSYAQDGADPSSAGMGAGAGAGADAASAGAGAGAAGAVSVGGGSSAGGAENLYRLKSTTQKRILTLDEALQRAAVANYDLRGLREKVVQQETQVRKAWSALLPQVSLGATYNYNCLVAASSRDGTTKAIDCSDQTLQFTSQEQLDQQALLFNSIGGLVERAAEFEPDPAAQEAQREQARQLFTAADQIKNTNTDPIVIQPAHVLSGNLNVSMPLFNGRAFPLLQNAYSAVDLVKLSTTQARSSLLYGVARAYYGAITAQRFIAIAEAQRDSNIRHRDAVKKRVELKTQTQLALQRAELEVVKAEQQVRSAKNAYLSAVSTIGTLIGETEMFDIVEPPAQISVETSASTDDLINQALSIRPEMRVQKIAVAIADRAEFDAWMMFMPSVALVGQLRATSNASGFVAAPINGTLLIQANIPIYDGGARYAALQESASKIREQLLKLRQLEEKVTAQVRGNIDEIAIKTEALNLSRQAVDLAKAGQAQAQAMFEAGVGTSLDVSDTGTAVMLAEAELARAELELQQARLGLAYIVGAFPALALNDASALSNDERNQGRERFEKIEVPLSDDPTRKVLNTIVK